VESLDWKSWEANEDRERKGSPLNPGGNEDCFFERSGDLGEMTRAQVTGSRNYEMAKRHVVKKVQNQKWVPNQGREEKGKSKGCINTRSAR